MHFNIAIMTALLAATRTISAAPVSNSTGDGGTDRSFLSQLYGCTGMNHLLNIGQCSSTICSQVRTLLVTANPPECTLLASSIITTLALLTQHFTW
jgi:hypothetical protein